MRLAIRGASAVLFGTILAVASIARADGSPLTAGVEAGVVHSSSTYGGDANGALVGLDLGYRLAGGVLLYGGAHDVVGSATYYSIAPAPDGSGPQRLDVGEQRFDAGAGAGYELPLGERDRLVPFLGFRYVSLDNSALPAHLAGARIAVANELRLSDRASLELHLGWTYGLAKAIGGPAALGKPIGDTDAGASILLDVGERTEVSVGYNFEAIAFEYNTRTFQGLVLALARSF